MAIILRPDGTAWAWSNYTKVAIDDWTAVTVAFEAVKAPSSFSFSVPTPVWGGIATGDGVEREAALIVNEAGEPYMRQSGWLCVTSQDESTTSITFYSDARASEASKTLQEVAESRMPSDISAPAYLVRDGDAYTLDGYATDWELVTLFATSGAYSLAFFRLTDDILVLANGTKVETGTDKEGKTISEADYISAGCSWRLPLAAALPSKTVSDVLNAYYWPQGKRLIYDPSGCLTLIDGEKTGLPHYTPMVEAMPPLAAIDPMEHDGTVELAHSLTNVKLGTELYPATKGVAKYAEGWTATLLQWTKAGCAGADEATVCSIGVNGQATTDHYLDDEGKPYSGLVFRSRPEPAGSEAFLSQFAATKHARKVTFSCADLLPVNASIPFGAGVAWVTKRKRTATGYDYEGVAVMRIDEELLTSATLIFPPTGGSKWVAASATGVEWVADDALAGGPWPVSVEKRTVGGSLISQAVLTVGANRYLFDPTSKFASESSTIQDWYKYNAETLGIAMSDYYQSKIFSDLTGKLTRATGSGLAVNVRVVGWQPSQTAEKISLESGEPGYYVKAQQLTAGDVRVFAGSVPSGSVMMSIVRVGADEIDCGQHPVYLRVIKPDGGAATTRFTYENWECVTVKTSSAVLIYAGFRVIEQLPNPDRVSNTLSILSFSPKQF